MNRVKMQGPSRTPNAIMSAFMISTESYWHASTFGSFRYRENPIPKDCHKQVDIAVRALMSNESGVVFAERSEMCEHQFISRLQDPSFRAGSGRIALIFTNSDDNIHSYIQRTLRKFLPNMRVCYGNNMARSAYPDVFHALPLGLASHHWAPFNRRVYETDIRRARTTALPWVERSSKVLVFDTEASNSQKNTRLKWLRKLRNDSFARLTTMVESRVSFHEMMRLCARHKFVFSPPGVGFDAFRTWEIVAIGSVPVVIDDERMDLRLFDDFRTVRLPNVIHAFTPTDLETRMNAVSDATDEYPAALYTSFWQDRWWRHLKDT